MSAFHTLTYNARRVRQTLSTFDNGSQVLRSMASRSTDDLIFETQGLTIACPNVPGARLPVYEVFAEDGYRLRWFAGDLGPAPTVLDIGAHIGCFSLFCAAQFPGARVEAYEPTPTTSQYLDTNIATNQLAERVHSHRSAVGATSGMLRMTDDGVASVHNGVLHLGDTGASTFEVPCSSLADAFEAAGGAVDFIKIDAEGAEYDIVLNAPPELWKTVRRVVMEYHPLPGRSFDELTSFFEASGLHLARHEPTAPGLGLAWFSRDPLP